MSQVSYGTITITDTNDIESITVEYNRNQSSSEAPSTTDSGWSTTRPDWAQGYYIWQRTRVHKSGTTADTDVIGTAVCITGSTGSTGAAGQSLTATKTEYTVAASNVTINLDNHTSYTWTTNTPEYDSSKPAYWGRITNTYTNPSKTEYLFYKDEALSTAVSDSAVANSIAQHASEDAQGAMSQSASNISEVKRIWYAQAAATPVPNAPTTGITTSAAHDAWSITKPAANESYQYYFYCDQTKTGGGIYSWSEVILDTSTLSQYQIGAMSAKVRNYWWDSVGAHIASGTSTSGEISETSPTSSYGYNTLTGLTGISFKYNDAKVVDLNSTTPSLDFYQPPTISGSTVTQGKKTMMLSANALTFYDPTDGQTERAVLDTNGLVLKKGGITGGTFANQGTNNHFVYLSTEDYGTSISINGHSASNWRQVIGTKFGVDNDGNLYANNATISGAITVQAGSDLSAGLSNYSTTTQMNQAIGNATEDMATTEYIEGLGYQTAQDVSEAVTSGIQNASVTDLSDGNNYSTTADMNTAINTATGNLSTAISNTYATKTEAVVKEQRVYRRFTSAQSTFSGLNTWVTSGNGYTAWSTSIPQLTNGTTTYPFLYMSTQTQTATQAANSGTGCSFTTPQLNAMTTVIDGNSIIANSIAAGKINVENLQVLSADMGTLTAGKITKGNNTVDFDNGTLEFKNQSTWTATTQGIKYDSTGLAIKGTITATSLTIDSGATVSGLSTSDISGINNYATVTAAQGYANDASYLVEIEVRDVNYTTPTATLFAHVYYKGGELTSSTNPAISSISFQWKKVVVNSGIYSVIDITNATNQSLVTSDLDTTYICVISNNS